MERKITKNWKVAPYSGAEGDSVVYCATHREVLGYLPNAMVTPCSVWVELRDAVPDCPQCLKYHNAKERLLAIRAELIRKPKTLKRRHLRAPHKPVQNK